MSTPCPVSLANTPISDEVTICEETGTFYSQAGGLGTQLLISPTRYAFIRHGCLRLFFEHTTGRALSIVFEGYSYDCLFPVIETLYYQDKNLTLATLRLTVLYRQPTPHSPAFHHCAVALVAIR